MPQHIRFVLPRLPATSLSLALAITLFLLLWHSSGHAVVLFTDDFNRSNSQIVNNGWSEYERDSNDVAVSQQQARLRDHQNASIDAAIWQTVTTSGFTNLYLDFSWRATSSTESSDTLHSGWRDLAGNFHTVWSTALGGSPFSNESIHLDGLGIPTQFDLAFWVNMSASNETVYLDNIILSGDAAAVVANPAVTVNVSEPEGMGLLLAGLFCVWALRRRNN